MSREIILLNITGKDHPGLTAALADVLADNGVNILDIGQAVIHNHLSLGMLLEVHPEAQSGPVVKDLLFQAHQLGLNINFTPIENSEYESWVGLQGKPRYIVTLLGRKLTARNISRVARIVSAHELNIDSLAISNGRLTGEVQGNIVDGARKAELLEKMADDMGISLKQVIAVGDGANDLPMLSLAGLGVAFHAKPVVRKNARHAISTLGLDSILYLLGVRDREIS